LAPPAAACHTFAVWWLALVLCSFCVDEPPPKCAGVAECFAIADALAHGDGRPKNERAALRLFAEICEKASDGAACYNASALLGDDAAERALRYLEKACAAKVLVGCADLGVALREGRGAAKDAVRARVVLGQACRGAVADACAELSDMWAKGEGGGKDAQKARALREAACQLGDEEACAK
jgi:TPR repeat protein